MRQESSALAASAFTQNDIILQTNVWSSTGINHRWWARIQDGCRGRIFQMFRFMCKTIRYLHSSRVFWVGKVSVSCSGCVGFLKMNQAGLDFLSFKELLQHIQIKWSLRRLSDTFVGFSNVNIQGKMPWRWGNVPVDISPLWTLTFDHWLNVTPHHQRTLWNVEMGEEKKSHC